MAEPLADQERRALELLRDEEDERFAQLDRPLRARLLSRGLVQAIVTTFGTGTTERYSVTGRGWEALEARQQR